MKSAIRPLAALISMGCLSIAAVADQAPADTAPPAAVPANLPPPVIREIVVTGQRPDVETRVDRKIYAVSHDLQASLGTAADVLGNIPSVSIDIDGNPSLRGDDSVQIFIDGRPAPEFNGSGRGAALQQFDADNIDRIEILTNPPANYKREGSGGIINIVTKRPSSDRTASARASVGTAGRYNASTGLGAQLGKLNLRGSAALRRDLRIREISDRRSVRDAAGTILSDRRQHVQGEDDRLGKTFTLGADYDMSDADRLSAAARFFRRDAGTFLGEDSLFLDSEGALAGQVTRTRRSDDVEHNGSLELTFHHRGEGDGDGLTVSAHREEYRGWEPLRHTYEYVIPPQSTTFQHQDHLQTEALNLFDVDYAATLASGGKIVSGYAFEGWGNVIDVAQTLQAVAADPLVPDPNFTNRFLYAQTNHAVYFTYERPFGDWTILAGLRLEQTDIDLDQVTTDQHSSQDYLRAYPSLHLANKLNEQQTLTFSYARRVRRPYWEAFNPFRFQQGGEFALGEGDPDLQPSEIDSLEAGWSFDKGKTSLSTTLYARRNRNDFTFISTPLSPTVVLSRPQNIGESDSGGLEFTAAGRLLPQLDYRLSGEAYYSEIDAGNLGFTKTRASIEYETKGALNWRMTSADSAQINLSVLGKSRTPQGYQRNGGTWLDLGYRHQFRPNFSISVTATDVFASRRFLSVTNTVELSGTTSNQPVGRVVFIGFSWSLVAKKDPVENFEYDQ
ncbi:MAG: TonB-dependent receptor [Pseudomonadota bacterium]